MTTTEQTATIARWADLSTRNLLERGERRDAEALLSRAELEARSGPEAALVALAADALHGCVTATSQLNSAVGALHGCAQRLMDVTRRGTAVTLNSLGEVQRLGDDVDRCCANLFTAQAGLLRALCALDHGRVGVPDLDAPVTRARFLVDAEPFEAFLVDVPENSGRVVFTPPAPGVTGLVLTPRDHDDVSRRACRALGLDPASRGGIKVIVGCVPAGKCVEIRRAS